MNWRDLAFYRRLAYLFPGSSYRTKILAVAAAGLVSPLLILLGFALLFTRDGQVPADLLLLVALLATLATGVVVLTLLARLLAPVALAADSLHAYRTAQKLPVLPSDFPDEAGRVLAGVQETLIRLDDLAHELDRRGAIDLLTGIPGRAGAENRLLDDLARVRRGAGTLLLVLADVDGLSGINRRYGQTNGDLCLQHVVATVRSTLRQGDWLARWGGDELLLVLFNAPEDVPVLDRIRTELRAQPVVSTHGEPITVTLSMGVCQSLGQEGIGVLLDHAQAALEQAQHAGGDRVVPYRSALLAALPGAGNGWGTLDGSQRVPRTGNGH